MSAARGPAEAAGFRWWPAPAKLNLFLHITGRRADGFHELQTLFQLLDWGDQIGIEVTADASIERLEGPGSIAPDDDLAVRAARALRAATGVRQGARIRVRKRVPPGSGLGGGSSDAATVLRVLDQLWGTALRPTELAALGLTLGSDVPIFVLGSSAWGEALWAAGQKSAARSAWQRALAADPDNKLLAATVRRYVPALKAPKPPPALEPAPRTSI